MAENGQGTDFARTGLILAFDIIQWWISWRVLYETQDSRFFLQNLANVIMSKLKTYF